METKANGDKKIKKNKILIVDNEKSTLSLLKNILGSDFTIYTAQNGKEAIEKANKIMPDIIILDIIMPEMNGYETIEILKSSEKTRNIPVIFITALNNVKEEEYGLSLGAADYIGKPFNPAIVKLRVFNQIKLLNYVKTIEKLSKTDMLTDIHNRRSFDNLLQIEWKNAMRLSNPLSIFMIDVDKFKSYNDTYGHQQGDLALQTIAKVIRLSLKRSSDFVARWGGEEFTVLLDNTGVKGALALAEIIRENVEKEVIPLPDGKPTNLTVSIGVNTQNPSKKAQEKLTIDSFIFGADEALYEAKRDGRNCVRRYGK